MRSAELALVYAGIGLLALAALWARRARLSPGLADYGLVALFWPLYAPLLFLRPAPPRAIDRVAVARARLERIEALLGTPAFDRRVAERRRRELESSGDHRAAEVVAQRGQMIERVERMRDHFRRELEEIHELEVQLDARSALAAIAGDPVDAEGLIAELSRRVEALEAMSEVEEIYAPARWNG